MVAHHRLYHEALRYHLSERIGSPYRIEKTANYIAGQLLIWGPFTTIPALFFFSKGDTKNSCYERAHFFTFWGIALFFLISSLRSTIEPHWTLAAGPSFVLLLLRVMHQGSLKLKSRFSSLLAATIALIFIARLLFLIPASPVKKLRTFDELAYAKSWADSLHRYMQGRTILFVDSYRLPSLYKYYQPAASSWAYNTVKNRKTQFTIYGDAFLNNQAVYLASTELLQDSANFFKTPYVTLFFQNVDSFKATTALKIQWADRAATFKKAQIVSTSITLQNTGKDTIETADLGIDYTFLKTRSERYPAPAAVPLPDKKLPPGYKKTIILPLQLPGAPGKYRLLFSITQPPLAGTFASPFYKVAVE